MDFLLQTQSRKWQRDILVTYITRHVSTWDTSFQIWPDNDKGSPFLRDKVTQHLGALPKGEQSPDVTRRFSSHTIVLIVKRDPPTKEGGPRVPEEKNISELSVLDVATRRVYLDLQDLSWISGLSIASSPKHHHNNWRICWYQAKQSFDYAVRESITFADLVVSLKG